MTIINMRKYVLTHVTSCQSETTDRTLGGMDKRCPPPPILLREQSYCPIRGSITERMRRARERRHYLIDPENHTDISQNFQRRTSFGNLNKSIHSEIAQYKYRQLLKRRTHVIQEFKKVCTRNTALWCTRVRCKYPNIPRGAIPTIVRFLA
jgi:hypothetical protein